MAGQPKKISEVVEDYLDYRRPRVASATWKQESYVFRRLARDLPDIQIRNLTGDHVGAWFFGPNGILVAHLTGNCRSREPVTAATANYYRTRLAGLFKYTAQRGLTRVALLDDVPVQPEVRRVRQQPPPAVLLELPNHTDNDRDRAFIGTAINSGMRSSEITGLRLSDVDLDEGYLRVVVRKTHEEDRFPITGDLDPEPRRWLTTYAGSMSRPLRGDEPNRPHVSSRRARRPAGESSVEIPEQWI